MCFSTDAKCEKGNKVFDIKIVGNSMATYRIITNYLFTMRKSVFLVEEVN